MSYAARLRRLRSVVIDGDELDAQHQRLIDIVFNLADSAPGAYGPHLDEVKRLTSLHFVFEERLQSMVGYPGLNKHHQGHRTFIRQVRNIETRYAPLFMPTLLDFVVSWLEEHILIEDMALRPYITAYNENKFKSNT